MTRDEWLCCDDPARMLAWLGGRYAFKVSERRLRLFCLACRPGDEYWQRWDEFGHRRGMSSLDGALFAAGLPNPDGGRDKFGKDEARRRAALLRDVAGDPFAPALADCGPRHGIQGDTYCGIHHTWHVHVNDEATMCPRGLGYFRALVCTPTVLSLAQAAYDERGDDGTLDPVRLLVLADALEEAGADNPELLDHLRSPGPHVRGCWAVDLILGKE